MRTMPKESKADAFYTPPEPPRNKVISFRLSEEERARLANRSKEDGIEIKDLIRLALDAYFGHPKSRR